MSDTPENDTQTNPVSRLRALRDDEGDPAPVIDPLPGGGTEAEPAASEPVPQKAPPDLVFILGDATGAIEHGLYRAAEGLIGGTKQDLALLAARISSQVSYASLRAVEGDTKLLDSLPRQVRLLGEAARLRASDAQWAAFSVVAQTLAATVGLFAGRLANVVMAQILPVPPPQK